jgi:hypothetical protein
MKRQAGPRPFRTCVELAELVDDFESGALPRAEWDHRAHLSVALWYLYHYREHEATRRMILGIQRYNHAHGISTTPRGGYHETLTVFWLAVVRMFLRSFSPDKGDVLSLANALVGQFWDQRRLASEFFSDEVLWSPEARSHWVKPDLKPLTALAI